jgi:hypothetical protein
MTKLAFSASIIERTAFQVRHHHPYTNIEGIYQILIENDFLVNLQEKKTSYNAMRKVHDEIVGAYIYPENQIRRASRYLYTKETKFSFAIEHIEPTAPRTGKFIAALKLAEKEDFCEKTWLLDLQNRVFDPQFADTGYRKSQNYVGQMVAYRNEVIHYICPKPVDLPCLMEGLINCHKRMKHARISPSFMQQSLPIASYSSTRLRMVTDKFIGF